MQSEEQAQTPTSAGAILRKAREDARVQLPTMAATLKVPEHKLEALEADNYAAFPDHVFMRALAMGMCRTLHIESEPVLALLPRSELRSLANTGPGINEAVKERGRFKAAGTPLDSRGSGSRKVVAGVLVLLAAAAAVYFIPFHQIQGAVGTEEVVAGAAVNGAAAPAGQPETGTVVEPGAAVSLGQAPANGAVNPTPEADTTTAPATDVSNTTPAVAAAMPAPVAATPAIATPAASPAAAATGAAALVEFKAQGQSWIKVKDSTGKVVMEKTLAKDQSVTAEGSLPLSVTVGNAKGTQVLVRGVPLDISTTRDNVARFEVK
jgi:cytoskeleton protein RodZ